MAKDGIFDQLYKGIVDAVHDIRTKVVEEPYFGRAVTEGRDSAAPQWPEAKEQETSFGGITRHIEVGRDQMQDDGKLAAMERDLNPQWPKATGHTQSIEQERDRHADREMDR